MTYEFGVIPNETIKETRDDSPGIIIDSPWMARRLLKAGHRIIDIKPNPDNRVKTRFIFMRDDSFYKDLLEIKARDREES